MRMVRTASPSSKPTLICGGAGFIGTNLASRLLASGARVLIYDDLSRPGVERNIAWLQEEYAALLEFELADIRDTRALRRCVRAAGAVFHFAGQTAVTTSLIRPREDFEINALGTLMLLEELRSLSSPIPLLFTSTNKVYGDLSGLSLERSNGRYAPVDRDVSANGVSETCPLSFHSPYGCSKGAADQYVLDYARSFGMPNVVFRMSCIYGPHQCGTEDQGWLAHFAIQALQNRPIAIYGDGMQVRDVLYVDDLVDAFILAIENAGRLSGQAFNIGGGPANATSLLEVISLISELQQAELDVGFHDWRIGDQRYYVSDTRAFRAATNWQPKVSVRDGVNRLYEWLLNRDVFTPDAVGAMAMDALRGGIQ